MRDTPVCSIIVPVYNAQTHIARTLESVCAQTLTQWELIAVDDGSCDDSSRIVREFADRDSRICPIRQSNGGVAVARNRGFIESNPASPYVIFLDHDDTWPPEALATLVAALEADPTACGAHGWARYIDAEDRPHTPEFIAQHHNLLDDAVRNRRTVVSNTTSSNAQRTTPNTQEYQPTSNHLPLDIESRPDASRTGFATFAVNNCILSPGAVLLRRSMLSIEHSPFRFSDSYAPFSAYYAPCDDWHLWIHLTRRADLLALPQTLFNYRLHTGNASHQQAVMDAAWHRVMRESIRSPENSPEQKQIARVALEFVRKRRISQRLRWAQEALQKGDLLQVAHHLRHAARARALLS